MEVSDEKNHMRPKGCSMSTANDEQQTITRNVKADGSIEVTVTPITSNVKTYFVDEHGTEHVGIISEKDLRAMCNIPDDWDCISFKPNNWVQQKKEDKYDTISFIAHQAKGTFAPPHPGKAVAEDLIAELRGASPVVPAIHSFSRDNGKPRRMLEISVMDPHIGLYCFPPGADAYYDIDLAEKLYMWAVKELSIIGAGYGDIEEILFPIGNDFLHGEMMAVDGKGVHATSAGTPQPEMISWHEVYKRGAAIMRQAITYLSHIAPVTVLQVPGNHDRYGSYTFGILMDAYFENNENVTVDCSPSPYKFKHYGVNLIGFEHGHSVSQIRLAALMANECSDVWNQTKYREWHLGDQHRKGSAKPSVLEEQGVSVEFLPSITAPNEWHRLKSFNWQKRGAMGWLWDYDTGPLARLQVNIDRDGNPYGT
jgi:hypothetical protein